MLNKYNTLQYKNLNESQKKKINPTIILPNHANTL